LVALTTFSDLVGEAREKAMADARAAGLPDHPPPLHQGGTGATAYADAIETYLAFAISKIANIGSSIASWMSDRGAFRETFARQAIPMVWDFAESNPFADAGGSFLSAVDKGAMAIADAPALSNGSIRLLAAQREPFSQQPVLIFD
jgi:putative DNA methylase